MAKQVETVPTHYIIELVNLTSAVEAAEALGLSPSSVYEAVRTGTTRKAFELAAELLVKRREPQTKRLLVEVPPARFTEFRTIAEILGCTLHDLKLGDL